MKVKTILTNQFLIQMVYDDERLSQSYLISDIVSNAVEVNQYVDSPARIVDFEVLLLVYQVWRSGHRHVRTGDERYL